MSRRRSSSSSDEPASNPLSTSYHRGTQEGSSSLPPGRQSHNGMARPLDAAAALPDAEAESGHHAVSINASPPRRRTESAADRPLRKQRTSIYKRALPPLMSCSLLPCIRCSCVVPQQGLSPCKAPGEQLHSSR